MFKTKQRRQLGKGTLNVLNYMRRRDLRCFEPPTVNGRLLEAMHALASNGVSPRELTLNTTYYLDQAASLQVYDFTTIDSIRDANCNAITQYNIEREEGTLPTRFKNGELLEHPEAPMASAKCRECSDEVVAVAKLLPGHARGAHRRLMPGVLSYNSSNKTFNVVVTERDYVLNKTTQMKVGRYFRKLDFYDDNAVNNLANKFKSLMYAQEHMEVLWATTPDECEEVYANGPNSCMSGDSFYEGHCHPARVYGTDDVHVAYAKMGDRIVARVVCNMNDKEYSTFYGNRELLKPLLVKAGFTSGGIAGCRLHAIEDSDHKCYIMPYLDDGCYCEDMGDGYVIVDQGDIEANQTNGLSLSCHTCYHCGESVSDDEVIYNECNDESYCSYECVEDDDYITVEGTWSTEFVHRDDCYYCETNGEYHANTDRLVYCGDAWYLYTDDTVVYSEDQDEYIFSNDAVFIDSIDSWVDDTREDEFAEQLELLEEDEDT